MRDVAPKETVLGIPAMPDKQAKRQWIAVQKLPEVMLRLRELGETGGGVARGGRGLGSVFKPGLSS